MRFCQTLNALMEKIPCSSQELAEASGLSAAAISRYRAGQRTPAENGASLQKLSAALAGIAAQKGGGLTQNAVAQAFRSCSAARSEDTAVLAQNFDTLVSVLKINLNQLARSLNFDTSYLSRIRRGQRRPADPLAFAKNVCDYVVWHDAGGENKHAVCSLLGCDCGMDDAALALRLQDWLWQRNERREDHLLNFLKKLDAFDLNTFIRSLPFDRMKFPVSALQLPESGYFYGIPGFRQAELSFLAATARSESTEPVFLCSDMPMADMAKDRNFAGQWITGLAMLLKKGLRLNVIHNVSRPFDEMMLGLEHWIPLYMTGQISPYYLKGVPNRVYGHLNYASGAAALEGQCVSGSHADGRYYFYSTREDVGYYQRKAASLLKKASPLMDILTEAQAPVYRAFTSAKAPADCRNLLSTLPIYTLSERTLEGLLSRRGLPPQRASAILAYAAQKRRAVEEYLAEHSLHDRLPRLSEEEFAGSPLRLSLSGLFADADVFYDEESYGLHLRKTEAFAESHPGYSVQFSAAQAFRNIQIFICEGHWTLISKNTCPAIHFVIRHPQLWRAIESLC